MLVIIPGGNLNPKIVSKKINTIMGKIMLTKIKYIILLSPQQYETKIDNSDMAKKKSNVFDIMTKKIKLSNVKKNGWGNFFLISQGFFLER